MEWVTNIGAIVGVILGAGAVAGVIAAGLFSARADTLRKDRDDLRARTGTLEDELVRLRAEIAELRADNKTLQRTLTGQVHWQALTEDLDRLIRDAKRHWDHESEGIENLLECLNKVAETQNRIMDRLEAASP